MSDQTSDEEIERARRAQERQRELRDIPIYVVDRSKWPKAVRPIGLSETGGLGIDRDGRLHWDGKPVEIIGRRLDLTRTQSFFAIIVAVATIFGMLATCILAGIGYQEWACKVGWPAVVTCPQPATSAPGLPRGVVRPAP